MQTARKFRQALNVIQSARHLPNGSDGGLEMKSHYLSNKLMRVLLTLSFIAGIGLVSSVAVQAQRTWDRDQDRQDQGDRNRRDRDRNYRRNRDNNQNRDYNRNDQYNRDRYGNNNGRYGNNGGYGNYGGYGNASQIALSQGYQDGLYTGSSDAQRGQNYSPQRSHFYRNGRGNSGGYYGNSYQYQQAYRNGFLRGYDEGFQRNGGYNRNRRNNGNYGRFPFPW